MKGFIEIKEDSYEDAIEHLHRIKLLTSKLVKMLSEHSEIYDEDEDEDEMPKVKSRKAQKGIGRYEY